MTVDHPDDDIALVGEYALGVLEGEDRRAFEARLVAEPNLAALLVEWQERLAPLAEDVAAIKPPRGLKQQINAQLFGAGKSARAPRPTRMLAGLLAGLLAALIIVAVLLPPHATPDLVAQVAAEDRSLVVDVAFFARTGELRVTRRVGASATGRVLELWLIADGAPAPVSLGVLPADPVAQFVVAQGLVAALSGATLAISDEPLGGSPTGQPTGAVLAVGRVGEG